MEKKQTDLGEFIVRCGQCNATIYQKDMRYYADRPDPCTFCQRVLAGEDDTFGLPSVANEMGWCGCGDHDALDRMMTTYLESRASEVWPKPALEEVSADATLLLAYLADQQGWTEHGTSIRGAWLTDDGKEVLGFLQAMREQREEA